MRQSSITESLKSFCGESNRVCPLPPQWSQLYELLPKKVQKPSGGWEPPLPLILGGWSYSSDPEKKSRLLEHIHWAEQHGVIDKIDSMLRALTEIQWHHIGE